MKPICTVGFSDLSAVTANAAGALNGINSTVATASAQTLAITITPTDADPLLSVNADILLVEMIT